MINAHLKTRDALGGDMVFDDASLLLVPLRENDESEKLVVKANCDLEQDTIVVSKDSFIEDEYSVKETPLEEPYVGGCGEVTSSYVELVDATLIEFSLKHIPTFIVLCPHAP